MNFYFSLEQKKRLEQLGLECPNLTFVSKTERDKAFQIIEKKAVTQAKEDFNNLIKNHSRPLTCTLAEKISEFLRKENFIQVETPIIINKQKLIKMGLKNNPLMEQQVFWLNDKQCLRPMLAPNLYEFMISIHKWKKEPFGIFELGSCFRKETQGAKHANEFTMLNLVEVGLKIEDCKKRLLELINLLTKAIQLKEWQLIEEESNVYGQTIDLVSNKGLEIASTSMGPHPLDEAFGFQGTWIGIGLGLERLAMALSDEKQLAKVGRGLNYICGIPLRL